jgi:LPXTG-site transpeptidase (sortase) family protein
VTDTLPSNLSFVSTGTSPECNAVGQVVTCTLTGIPAVLARLTGSHTFTIVTRANATGPVANSATVTSGGISGSVSSLASVGTIPPTTLSITKTGTPLSGLIGTAVTFTVTIENTGLGNTVGTYSVADTLATGLVFDAADSDTRCTAVGQVVTCADTAVLAPGASTSFDIKATIAAAGSYENTATVSGGSAISATSNTVTVVRTAPPSGGGGGGGGVIGTWCPSGQTWNGSLCVTTPKPVTPVLTPTVPKSPSSVLSISTSLRKSRLGLLWQTGSDTFGSCGYPVLTTPIKLGKTNKVSDVKFLEQFLNTYENEKLTVNGIYEQEDFEAVIRWQEKYASAVLAPWGVVKGTGYVYKTSLAQIARQYKTVCTSDDTAKPKTDLPKDVPVPVVADIEITSTPTNITGTRIRIPAIGLDKIVYTTGTLKQVKDNIWHSPDTEMPHEGGNTVFVGHRYVNLVRDAKGNVVQIPPKPGVFFELPSVPVGSDIYATDSGREYHYRVTQSFEVKPDEIWVEDETTNPTLTLYTCTPLYTHNKRHVIRAELVK